MIRSNNIIKREIAHELHKPKRINYIRRDVNIRGFKDMFQCDLIEMIPFARVNKGFRYILAVIDSFSKYAWTRPIKKKNSVEVTNAMRDILTCSDKIFLKPPKLMCSDRGREFYNSNFQSMLNDFNIQLYSVYSTKKACLVERFIRTFKNMIYLHLSLNRSHRWCDMLQDLTYQYNHRIHRTIKMKPADVQPIHLGKLQELYFKKHREMSQAKIKFHIGDCVRISHGRMFLKKNEFEKSYTPNWSTELFYISKIKKTIPITYELIDFDNTPIKGSFYNEELTKSQHSNLYLIEKLVKYGTGSRKGFILVKFHGIKDYKWILEKDII